MSSARRRAGRGGRDHGPAALLAGLMTGWGRLGLAAVFTAIFIACGVTSAGPALASARPVGDCTARSGALVAVDFARFGGPVLRACGSTPTTGLDLLNQGGWRTTGTVHDGPGFVCRIGYAGFHGGTQYPTPSQDACVVTPPASAYWAFWVAGPGQDTWTYSAAGGASYDPRPGSVELWVFGGTSQGGASGSALPAVSPDSLRPYQPGRAAASSPTASAPPSTAPASATRPTRASSSVAAPSSAPVTSSAPAPVSDAPPAAGGAHSGGGGGSPLPALVTLVVVVILAAAGITVAARRSRRAR